MLVDMLSGSRGFQAAGSGVLALEVGPESAHGVMDGGENPHRLIERVGADELFVDLQNAFELVQDGGPAAGFFTSSRRSR